MELARHTTLIPLFEELRGPLVVVRPYRLEDADEVFAAIDESRQHIWPWMPWGDQHQTVEDTRDFILRTQAKWLLREDDSTVGIFEASERALSGWLRPAYSRLGCASVRDWLLDTRQRTGARLRRRDGEAADRLRLHIAGRSAGIHTLRRAQHPERGGG